MATRHDYLPIGWWAMRLRDEIVYMGNMCSSLYSDPTKVKKRA